MLPYWETILRNISSLFLEWIFLELLSSGTCCLAVYIFPNFGFRHRRKGSSLVLVTFPILVPFLNVHLVVDIVLRTDEVVLSSFVTENSSRHSLWLMFTQRQSCRFANQISRIFVQQTLLQCLLLQSKCRPYGIEQMSYRASDVQSK